MDNTLNEPDSILSGMRNRGWTDEAACLGLPLDNFFRREHEKTERFIKRVDRSEGFLSCPSSCPVMVECALDALLKSDVDVVRAGVFINPKPSPEHRRAQLKLMKVASPVIKNSVIQPAVKKKMTDVQRNKIRAMVGKVA